MDERLISVPKPFVIDGCFNQFIKANWKNLEKGDQIVFNFIIPSKLDYFTLRATKIQQANNNYESKNRT
jgi:hypothetical protein